MKPSSHLSIKEAAARYEVSRAKLHRLIQRGRLQAAKDPRDERVTLLRTEELEALFRVPTHEGAEVVYRTEGTSQTEPTGRLTQELCDRMDVMRRRVGRVPGDSADIIREERAKRGQQVYQAPLGEDETVEEDRKA